MRSGLGDAIIVEKRCGAPTCAVQVSATFYTKVSIIDSDRSSGCNVAIHPRCLHHIQLPCSLQPPGGRDEPNSQMGTIRTRPYILPYPHADSFRFEPATSMFGRDLAEQVRSDSKSEDRSVPIIVEKCIEAVDALGKLP